MVWKRGMVNGKRWTRGGCLASDITSLMVDNPPPNPSFSDITRRGYVRARRIFGQTIFIFSLITGRSSRSFVRNQNPTTTPTTTYRYTAFVGEGFKPSRAWLGGI